jgi:hypothetical protein
MTTITGARTRCYASLAVTPALEPARGIRDGTKRLWLVQSLLLCASAKRRHATEAFGTLACRWIGDGRLHILALSVMNKTLTTIPLFTYAILRPPQVSRIPRMIA